MSRVCSRGTGLAAPSILLVDDDHVFRERLARSLRERGYWVTTAGDADEALLHCVDDSFDNAVVDLRMGRRSGLELLSELRQRGCARRIVVLTGYGHITSAVEAMRLGAHTYLGKPADAEDIIHAIQSDPSAESIHRFDQSGPTLARAGWEHIHRILSDCKGNISETARRLGITRRTLQLKLKKNPPRL